MLCLLLVASGPGTMVLGLMTATPSLIGNGFVVTFASLATIGAVYTVVFARDAALDRRREHTGALLEDVGTSR